MRTRTRTRTIRNSLFLLFTDKVIITDNRKIFMGAIKRAWENNCSVFPDFRLERSEFRLQT